MHFQAGQYVNFFLEGGEYSRAFSLANPPSTGREVELNIRIVPGGRGTTWIHEQLQGRRPRAALGPLRPLLRAQVGARGAAVHGRRLRPVEPAFDDPRPARGRATPGR